MDEASTLSKLNQFMKARGLGEEDTKLLEERLRHFGRAQVPSALPGREGKATPLERELKHVGASDSENAQGQDEGPVPKEAEDGDLPDDALQGYVVSIAGRKRFRRPHHITKCGLIPGTDYKEYAWYGDVLPEATLYDQVCRRCWRNKADFDLDSTGASAEVASASSSGESVSD